MKRTTTETAPRRHRAVQALTAGITGALALVLASTAFAQGAPSAGAAVWADAGCSSCHGGVGQGGGGGENPSGPNLWRSKLTKEALKDVVACGRENTQMPYHLAGAFTKHACWGKPLGEPPAIALGGAEMTEAQVDAVTDFLMANVVNQLPITKAKCGAFFGGNSGNVVCNPYPN